jgi:hypothetical protein
MKNDENLNRGIYPNIPLLSHIIVGLITLNQFFMYLHVHAILEAYGFFYYNMYGQNKKRDKCILLYIE